MPLQVNLHLWLLAQDAGQHGGVWMMQRLFRGDQIVGEQGLHGGVIGGEAVQAAGAQEVGAAVADVANPGVSSGGVLLQQGHHHGRAHAGERRAGRAGRGHNLRIDALHGLADGVIGRIIARQGHQMEIKVLRHHPRRSGSSRVPAGAVGDDQQVTQGNADMKDRILVLFVQGAAVALLGKENDGLPRDRYLAHV